VSHDVGVVSHDVGVMSHDVGNPVMCILIRSFDKKPTRGGHR